MGKINRVNLILSLLAFIGLFPSPLNALERRSSDSIPIDEFVKETIQTETNDNLFSMVWYIPLEAFGLPSQPVLLIAVVKARMSPFGAMSFASEAETQQGLKVTYVDSDGVSKAMVPAPKSDDISGFIAAMKPQFSRIAGPLGEGMWIFAYKNVDDSNNEIVSPYEFGSLKIDLGLSGNQGPSPSIQLPLNSLFVPRLCPGDKPAHITWKYCPWDGTPLPEI